MQKIKMHPGCNVDGELQQLLGREGGGSAMLLGEGRIGLQHSALPQKVQEVSVGGVFDGYVQVTWRNAETENREEEESIL
ncbi:hypothetical protein EYF80_045614 [Liparis tanakae]|uniref:Uncharacterized protein n=1 Tax=Liparis tanakae TaxID=230148 RepID=A0A4Z2FSI9_9TELE|nr:hypothetical protein EYF80_045614 [Liparis tanakae]